MGVPTSEVGYTPAMPRREDHEVHKGQVVLLEEKKTCNNAQQTFSINFNVFRGLSFLLPLDVLVILT